MWRKLFKEILYLKKGEQRALLVISIILCASLVFRVGLRRNPSEVHQPDKEFLTQIGIVRQKLEILDQEEHRLSVEAEHASPTINPEIFDPNRVAEEELIAMGFHERVVSNLIRYREAGGKFKKPEDLQKIYGMDSLSYHTVFNFIVIEGAFEKHGSLSESLAMHKSFLAADLPAKPAYDLNNNLELNSADSLDLIRIRGIGPVYSSRIIRYRALLGGFYSLEQLWEIYGMDSLKFENLSASLYVDTSLIRRRNINEISFSSLVRHPYITRQEVSDLIHYRNFAGEIKELKELKANQVLDSTGYEKIKHYLNCRINKY